MNRSKRELDALLERGTDEIRAQVPSDTACQEAAERALAAAMARLGDDATVEASTVGSIGGCDDVRTLLAAYVAGELPEAKALLVQDHTRECLPCRRALMAAREGRPAQVAGPAPWNPQEGADETAGRASGFPRWMLAAAAALVVGLGVAVLFATGILGGAGTAYARVDAIDGGLFVLGAGGTRPLGAGDEIGRGEQVRTTKASGAVLVLADGSRVEMRERTTLALFRSREDTTIDLERGSVIVEAAHRSRGHLFVDTEDCRVAVTGTIFSVNHGTKGSRVSVIEGEVRVEQGRSEELLQPGEQVTSRAYLAAVPLADEISWSRNVDHYLALLSELNVLHEELQRALPAPLPRTSTHLLDLAPADTAIYAAVPNVAESLSEARRVFRERLADSPALSELLADAGSLDHQQELDRLFERIRDYGSFLGDEVAFAVAGDLDGADTSAVAYAEVLEPQAFRTFLEQEMAVFGGGAPIHLVDDPAGPFPAAGDGIYVWLGDGFVVASGSPDGITTMAASIAAGGGGFAGTGFYQALADSYREGVEWLFAADLATVVARANEGEAPNLFGFEDARHLIARWSEAGEHTSARAVLTFDGPRRGVAAWLAAPAPMGSLEYVTGDAAAAAAFVVRDPAEMVDELMAMLLDRDPDALAELERIESEQGVDLREDLAAPLGGEIAIALDGPFAPSPSYKVVVEVYDPARLQQTLEWAVSRLNQEATEAGKGSFALTSEDAGGRTFYRLSTPAAAVAVYYTYDDAYLVAAPSRALLETALAARATGANLLAAERFRALLPTDGYTNFSAVAYQDLGSRLAPLARTLSQMQEGRELTAQERQTVARSEELNPPTLGYAYGEEDRIVFAASLGGRGSWLTKALLGASGGLQGLTGLEGMLADASADTSAAH